MYRKSVIKKKKLLGDKNVCFAGYLSAHILQEI